MRQHHPYLCHSILSTITTHPKTGCQMAQKNGLEAIGAMVCRHFGDDGYFVGIIISLNFSTDGSSLYRVKYSDGDMEDLDQEEYNYAYSLQLKRDGWTPLEEEAFGSDSNHSDNSQSTHAYKPAKVLHSFFVCFITLFITLFSLHSFHSRMLMIPTMTTTGHHL